MPKGFQVPHGEAAIAGAIVVGSVVGLLLLGRLFRDVAP